MDDHDATPRAPLPWTLLDAGSDMMLVIAPLRGRMPVDAVIERVESEAGDRLSLVVEDIHGRVSSRLLDESDAGAVARVLESLSVVVVEEDPAAPEGRGRAWVARVAADPDHAPGGIRP